MNWQNLFGFSSLEVSTGMGVIFILGLLWSLVWKGLGLWKAAKEGSKPWFIAILVLNTFGILEILYLYVFSRRKAASEPVNSPEM